MKVTEWLFFCCVDLLRCCTVYYDHNSHNSVSSQVCALMQRHHSVHSAIV